MKAILIAPLFISALFISVPAMAQKRLHPEQVFHKTAQDGQERHIFTYDSFSDRTCQPNPAPQVTIRTQPAHGTISIRPTKSVVTAIRNGNPACVGTAMTGTGIFYTPTPRFHGTDRFDWNVSYADQTAHDSAEVRVR